MLPGYVLLESADKSRGRYDILSAYPYDSLQLDDANSSALLERITKSIGNVPSNLDLPFQGGAIGYLSYDWAAKRSQIPCVPQMGLKGMPLAYFGFYDWAIITDHHLKKVILFSANTRPDTEVLVQEVVEHWNADRHECAESFQMLQNFNPLIEREAYRQSFQTIHECLQEGRCYQVNYSLPFNARYEGSTWGVYQRIRQANPVPFAAFMRLGQEEVLSFSPERFMLQEGLKMLTSPIKGTIKRGLNALEDEENKKQLRSSEKNKAENIMIVDLLRNDFGKIAEPGSVRVTSLCEIQSFRGVHHLVSHIEAVRKQDISPFAAFLDCFPGGSITGAPKLESMKVIAEQEKYARGVYCGSIVYLSRHGRFDSNIAIRTITARNNILHLSAGGGIVIDSDWEDEYCECLTKIAAITNVLT
ncbi:aminodeoxychorismate synthase component I [Legionella jordanis]|nr:aminodeoxychorismate synthase component I [Legionella jordanis]RMX03405.1 aminodeoxychorismate synthase component I [Legionella jordanis]RMX18314.1 aminodeoxychorismate synthase component I [Legionella jordanis]HAT8713290.1 aminodeoxychorismate synthase component I [Legionella jordanis]